MGGRAGGGLELVDASGLGFGLFGFACFRFISCFLLWGLEVGSWVVAHVGEYFRGLLLL